ncbi:MAG: SufE family protein, partial [Candidatus Thiodiazotropha sp.]
MSRRICLTRVSILSTRTSRISAVAASRSVYDRLTHGLERGMREIDEIVENFEFFDDWEGRYQYLIELGEALPAMPDELKREENWVKPCMSTVHV